MGDSSGPADLICFCSGSRAVRSFTGATKGAALPFLRICLENESIRKF
jgi:hypothetical protein